MNRKIYSLILCVTLFLSIVLFPGSAQEQRFNEGEFIRKANITNPVVRQRGVYQEDLSDARFTFDGGAAVSPGAGAIAAGVKDGYAYSLGYTTYVNMLITPEKAIPITTPNTIIKFRVKVEREEPGAQVIYVQVKLFDKSGEAEVYSNTNKQMQYGVWYEGQIEVGKAAATDGKRGFKPGDVISSINVMTRPNPGKYVSTYIEYMEAVEGPLSSWMVPDNGTEVIKNIASQVQRARPGDVITIPNGVYTNAELDLIGTGTKEKPITIKAETPGEVILNGSSRLTIDGDYLVVDGLYFKDLYNYRTIHFKPTSNNCRLTNTVILNCNDDGTELDSHWVTVQGTGHEVDHCFFRFRTAYSCLLDGIGKDFHFHHNYIGYAREGSLANGYEAVRTQYVNTPLNTIKGSSPAHFLFEYNFLDRCNGEDESISIKSNDNTIRYNTFYDTNGAVTCRMGDNQEIYGNLFIGGKETTRTTGVRFMGNNGVLKDNYFFNLPLSSGAVLAEAGNPKGNPTLTYYPPKNSLIQNNSFINCDIALSLNTHLGQGDYRTFEGSGRIENNLMISDVGYNYMIPNTGSIEGYHFSNNIAFGKPLGLPQNTPGFTIKKPELKKAGEFLYFPETPGVGADPLEIAKAPKTPLDLFDEDSWIRDKIIEAKNQEFNENGFQFDPLTEETYQREKNDPTLTYTTIWPAAYSVVVLKTDSGRVFEGNRLKDISRENKEFMPKIIEGKPMIPLRYISEYFGASVLWDPDTQKISVKTKEGVESLFIVGNSTVLINGKPVLMEAPVSLEPGGAMIPLSVVSEALQCMVHWDDRGLIVLSQSATFFGLFTKNKLFLNEALQVL